MFTHARDDDHDPSRRRQLQDGIYYRRKEGPARAYRVLLLNVEHGTTREKAHTDIKRVWKMLTKLRDGEVDLQSRGEERVWEKVTQHGNLTCLLGFGASLFAQGRNLALDEQRPAALVFLGDSVYKPFPSLRWAPGTRPEARPGESDLAIQFIADTELAVNRAVVEVYRLIRMEELALTFVTSYGGFNRDDKRSWLGFFDGVNNIKTTERPDALEVVDESAPGWMIGGTYMVFLRLVLDIEQWWELPRAKQELRVGRDKLHGCPLITGPGDVPAADPDCHKNPEHRESPQHLNPHPEHQLIRQSHILRANRTREGPDAGDRSNRIFRQGYEFLEAGDGRPRVGLNFVSFQCDLARFTNIMRTGAWLKDVNFGGPDDRRGIPDIELAQVIAGGYYAVPPIAKPNEEAFPGARIFR